MVNGTDGSVCPYIRIDNGDNYLILMTPSAVTSFVPGEATTPIQVGDSTFEDAYATDTENIYTIYGMTMMDRKAGIITIPVMEPSANTSTVTARRRIPIPPIFRMH